MLEGYERELLSWCLSGPCCSPHRVVYGAEAQGLTGCLYTSWHCCIPSLRFTAHVDQVVGMADGADALRDRLTLSGEALVLVVRSFQGLRRLIEAGCHLCRTTWTTLGRCAVAVRGVLGRPVERLFCLRNGL